MNKELKRFVSELRRAGLEVEHAGRGGHLRVLQDGHFIASLAMSPRSPHWRKAARGTLRRAGVNI